MTDTQAALLTPDEMATADRLTIAGGTTGLVLMERAGAAVAAAAAALLLEAPGSGRIAIFCGPGNNGGDGFVAARRLAESGLDVQIGLLGERAALRGDAATMAAAWSSFVVQPESLDLDDVALVIDALYGAGLSRPLEGAAAALVERLNAWSVRTGRPLLAVDIPSGIDGASGQIRGVAIEARKTVTFFRRKPGHLLLPGRLNCGEIVLAQIGIEAGVLAAIAPRCFANEPTLWLAVWPVPKAAGHKYSRGHAVVLSGPPAQTGAARLAARAALRAGAGLVTLATPGAALATNAGALTAVMTRVCDGADALTDLLADRRKNALVLGPGLGVSVDTRALVHAALAADAGHPGPRRAIVLDADALASFAQRTPELAAAIQAANAPVVMTPHQGEFSNLFANVDAPGLDATSKVDRVRAAADLIGATIVLKGADTVVAEPGGRANIAYDPPPWLATAGSGDVLAGMIGGLLAQQMPTFEAASAAVWLHGAAARHFGAGLIAEDLPDALPPVIQALSRRATSGA